MLPFFLQGLTLGFSAAVSPGPFQAYLLSRSSKNGLWRTLPAALAPLLSDGPIIALVLLVLTQTPDWFLRGLRILGGFFLLYLAWNAFLAFKNWRDPVQGSGGSARQSLFQAARMNILNPNPYIYWSLIGGPILIRGWASSPAWVAAFIGGFYITMIIILVCLIVLFVAARRLGTRAARVLNGISALALLLFGLYQLWQGFGAIFI